VLALQGIAFRGRDESSTSVNRGNFLEILNVVASYDKKVAEVIAKAPKMRLTHHHKSKKKFYMFFQ
jgi:hypothetical protein